MNSDNSEGNSPMTNALLSTMDARTLTRSVRSADGYEYLLPSLWPHRPPMESAQPIAPPTTLMTRNNAGRYKRAACARTKNHEV